jgi:hypothetical protein
MTIFRLALEFCTDWRRVSRLHKPQALALVQIVFSPSSPRPERHRLDWCVQGGSGRSSEDRGEAGSAMRPKKKKVFISQVVSPNGSELCQKGSKWRQISFSGPRISLQSVHRWFHPFWEMMMAVFTLGVREAMQNHPVSFLYF